VHIVINIFFRFVEKEDSDDEVDDRDTGVGVTGVKPKVFTFPTGVQISNSLRQDSAAIAAEAAKIRAEEEEKKRVRLFRKALLITYALTLG
jgi:hypothetical protein